MRSEDSIDLSYTCLFGKKELLIHWKFSVIIGLS